MKFTSPDREELAWAAGFFDGEGTFSAAPKASLRATLPQKSPALLQRFRDAVGLGKVEQEKSGMWRWRVSSHEHVQAVLAMLWFRLGEAKKNQARGALSKARAQWPDRTTGRAFQMFGKRFRDLDETERRRYYASYRKVWSH